MNEGQICAKTPFQGSALAGVGHSYKRTDFKDKVWTPIWLRRFGDIKGQLNVSPKCGRTSDFKYHKRRMSVSAQIHSSAVWIPEH